MRTNEEIRAEAHKIGDTLHDLWKKEKKIEEDMINPIKEEVKNLQERMKELRNEDTQFYNSGFHVRITTYHGGRIWKDKEYFDEQCVTHAEEIRHLMVELEKGERAIIELVRNESKKCRWKGGEEE